MTLTEEQRIAIIKHAAESSQKVSATQSVSDFIEEIKTEEVLGEHGLLDAQKHDIEDEMSLIDYITINCRRELERIRRKSP
jgi:hypothetical protein